ncbi:host cell division inhibitor Icd-like protein [Salmonella enterica]
MKINQKATLLNFFCLQGLTLPRVLAYRYSAPYKTGAGFSSLNITAGSRLVSDTRFFCARYTTLPRIMAGRSGGALALAGFRYASLLTPLRLATPFSSVLARLLKFITEAANMANHFPYLNGRTSSHLNPVRYPLFIWRFVSGQNNTTHTIIAASEREARLQLPAVRLIFAARIRLLEGAHHV